MQDKFGQLKPDVYPPALPKRQNLLTGEIVPDDDRAKRRMELEPVKQDMQNDIITQAEYEYPGDNRAKRRMELEQLKQDMQDDIITQAEYEQEHQVIMNKYPLR